MSESSKIVSYDLPTELITEILLKLPAKSLLRFKSVCKTCYALIKNHNFIERHHQSKSNINSILVTTTNRIYINNDGFYKPIDFGSMFSAQIVDFGLLGICNGLVCIAFYRPSCIVIGNPTTQEFRKLSWFKLQMETKGESDLFGFSSFSDDYKIVRIVYSSVVRAEVYSMSTDSWEKIDVKMAGVVVTLAGDAFYCRTRFFPVVLNGVFHWMASYLEFARIMSFDIYNGLFYEIRIPTSVLDALKDSWRIIEFEEELSLMIYIDDRNFELWALNEDRSTWTWKLRINAIPTVAMPIGDWVRGISVVGFTKNGELLVEDGFADDDDMKLLLYDLHSRETKILPQFDFHEDNYYYFYTESLRSVKLRNEVAEAV